MRAHAPRISVACIPDFGMRATRAGGRVSRGARRPAETGSETAGGDGKRRGGGSEAAGRGGPSDEPVVEREPLVELPVLAKLLQLGHDGNVVRGDQFACPGGVLVLQRYAQCQVVGPGGQREDEVFPPLWVAPGIVQCRCLERVASDFKDDERVRLG